MTNKEAFIEVYKSHLKFEELLDKYKDVGLDLSDSPISTMFYDALEVTIALICVPEANDILFQDILFRNMTVEEAVSEMEKYIING